MRPAPDLLRRSQTDTNGVKVGDHICHFEWARTKQGVPPLPADLTRPLTELVNQFSDPVLSKTGIELSPLHAALSSDAAVASNQESFASSVSDPNSAFAEN